MSMYPESADGLTDQVRAQAFTADDPPVEFKLPRVKQIFDNYIPLRSTSALLPDWFKTSLKLNGRKSAAVRKPDVRENEDAPRRRTRNNPLQLQMCSRGRSLALRDQRRDYDSRSRSRRRSPPRYSRLSTRRPLALTDSSPRRQSRHRSPSPSRRRSPSPSRRRSSRSSLNDNDARSSRSTRSQPQLQDAEREPRSQPEERARARRVRRARLHAPSRRRRPW